MKRARAIVIADRAAGFSLKLLAALNVGFLVLFLLVTLLAAVQIRAEAAQVENRDAIRSPWNH